MFPNCGSGLTLLRNAKYAQMIADRNKAYYNIKIRAATLAIGSYVLIRNVALWGKQKLADRWDKYPYVISNIPDKNVPVYKVQKESNSTVKILDRNMYGSVLKSLLWRNVLLLVRRLHVFLNLIPIQSDHSEYIPRFILLLTRKEAVNQP